jgi:hypothetical protein
MPAFTVQSLIDRAAAISDMHDGFVTTAQWLAWYNTERRAFAISMNRGGTLQDLVFNAVPVGQATQYTLTGENLAVVAVFELVDNSGRIRHLKIVPSVDFMFYGPGGSTHFAKAEVVGFEDANSGGVTATNFRFFPPDNSGTYYVVTLKSPAVATALTDTDTFPMGLEERIVLGMARRALIKEESDTSAVDKLIREVDDMIEEYTWGRSFAQANSVRNVDSVQRGWGWRFGFVPPNSDMWFWL